MVDLNSIKNKKAKYKIKHIHEETFDENIWVCYGTPAKYFIKQIEKELSITLELKRFKDGKAFEVELKDGSILYVIWTKKKDVSILAHEVLHVVHWLLGAKGMSLSCDSEEAYCYLLQRIIRAVLA